MTKSNIGPWTYLKSPIPDNTGGYDFAITDKDNNIIAEVFEHTGFLDDAKTVFKKEPVQAHAALIASAPELLEALERLIRICEAYNGLEAKKARAIVEKAKGAPCQ